MPSIYTADPAVLVHDCTFYITAGHDEGNTGFVLNNWYVLSSTDMVNWSDNGGPIMGFDVFSWANANAWAGQMVARNGLFYWYVPVNQRGGGMAIGVAVSSSPLGPFKDAIGGPLINDAIEMKAFNFANDYDTAYTIDPTVFVDNDGQAYLAYGGFGRMVTVKLGADMISLAGDMKESTPQNFFEAPYLTKRGDLYYMVYAAGVNPATIDYATATNPMGPWQYRGRILDALPKLAGQDEATSHPAIAELGGQWYLVYHISNGPGGGTYKRQVAIEKLTFNSNGTIQTVTPTSGNGSVASSSASSTKSSAASSSKSSTSANSSAGASSAAAFKTITTEFSHLGVNTTNALYKDSERFRVYYAGNGLSGAQGNLSAESDRDIEIGLAHLEAAYQYFVNDWGFRSTALQLNKNNGTYYRMNIYPTTTLNAGGAMGADPSMGLSFIEVKDGLLATPNVIVHEFGHALNYTAYSWVDQGRTGAWWEPLAEWVAETYINSPAYETVRQKYNLAAADTMINLESVIINAYRTIVHKDSYYQSWPIYTYLTNNPDNYPGMGKMVVPNLISTHQRNNETPLHVLERLTKPVSVQTIIGRYWARMAYMDINHPKALQRFLSTRTGANFKTRAYTNLDSLGNQTYRVKAARQPMYMGASINPLTVSGNGMVSVQVTNLGNGLTDSNFTATLAIRHKTSGVVRYVDLPSGSAQATISSDEEASLVVANTPYNLYLYNAFDSTTTSSDVVGLNFQVQLTGATPTFL